MIQNRIDMASMTATAVKKAARTKVEPQTLREVVSETLANHAGLQTAIAKHQELVGKLAKVEQELADANASCDTDVAELADRILAGDSLTEREQLFDRRQALTQRVQAHRAAVAKQAAIVAQCRQDAGQSVTRVVEPVYTARFAHMVESLQQFEDAIGSLMEVQRDLAGVHHSIVAFNASQFIPTVSQIKASIERSMNARR